METYDLPHFPSPYSKIHISLFQTVNNYSDIRKRLIAASTAQGIEGEIARRSLNYAFLNASLVRPFLLSQCTHRYLVISTSHNPPGLL